jgi:hypothetical protein
MHEISASIITDLAASYISREIPTASEVKQHMDTWPAFVASDRRTTELPHARARRSISSQEMSWIEPRLRLSLSSGRHKPGRVKGRFVISHHRRLVIIAHRWRLESFQRLSRLLTESPEKPQPHPTRSPAHLLHLRTSTCRADPVTLVRSPMLFLVKGLNSPLGSSDVELYLRTSRPLRKSAALAISFAAKNSP